MNSAGKNGLRGIAGLAAVFVALWIDLFIPLDPTAPLSIPWFLLSGVKGAVRTAILLAAMKFGPAAETACPGKATASPSPETTGAAEPAPGRPPSNRISPRASELLDALAIAASTIALALGFALLFSALGIVNPVLAEGPAGRKTAASFAAIAFSCLGTGYSEELFFRFFAYRRFLKSGLPAMAAAIACSLLFGASHARQGIPGMITAFALGMVFSLFRMKGNSLHSLALAHAAYDFAIIAAFA